MSSRERNLLILLIVMAFIAVNFLGYSAWYAPKIRAFEASLEAAQDKVKTNQGMSKIYDVIASDKDWLEKVEPKPTSSGKMKTQIQQLAEREAIKAELTVKKKGFGDDVIDSSLHYHRARFQIEVNGVESAIYRWLDRLHNPNQFRAVTFVRLKPQRDDATRADCEIYLDQWFVPEGGI